MGLDINILATREQGLFLSAVYHLAVVQPPLLAERRGELSNQRWNGSWVRDFNQLPEDQLSLGAADGALVLGIPGQREAQGWTDMFATDAEQAGKNISIFPSRLALPVSRSQWL